MEEKYIREIVLRSVAAQREMMGFGSRRKTDIIYSAADMVESRTDEILEVNAAEVDAARKKGRPEGFVKRLELSASLLRRAVNACRIIADLNDPIGAEVSVWLRPNGLKISRCRVPVGTVALCLETRPLVNAIASAICLKAGNSLLSCCDNESGSTSAALVSAFVDGAVSGGMPADAVQLITDDEYVRNCRILVSLQGLVDMAILRGTGSFVTDIAGHALIPVLKHTSGLCHTYVDSDSDTAMAVDVTCNSRGFDPYSCAATDVVLVHELKADEFIPALMRKAEGQIKLVAGIKAAKYMPGAPLADYADWQNECPGLRLAVGVVSSIEEAIDHINTRGGHLSDAIISNNESNQELFRHRVDSAVVYVNASTAFTDGFEFGMGADVGISTDKFNVRGPIGLEDLTCLKYLVSGSGQSRG